METTFETVQTKMSEISEKNQIDVNEALLFLSDLNSRNLNIQANIMNLCA